MMSEKNPERATLFAGVVLALIGGYVAGRAVTFHFLPGSSRPPNPPPLVLRPDTRPRIPVVTLERVRDGHLEGSLRGDVRLFLGETYVIPGSGGTFRVPAGDFFVHPASVPVPEGMRFVASRRGKRYYPVSSREGERLVPENRLYFRTAEEAERAGYHP